MNEDSENFFALDVNYTIKPHYKRLLERIVYLISGLILILLLSGYSIFFFNVNPLNDLISYLFFLFTTIGPLILILVVGTTFYANIMTNNMFIRVNNNSVSYYEGPPYKTSFSMWRKITDNYWLDIIILKRNTIHFNEISDLELIEDTELVFEGYYFMKFQKKQHEIPLYIKIFTSNEKKFVFGGRFRREDIVKLYDDLKSRIFSPFELSTNQKKHQLKRYFPSEELLEHSLPFYRIEKVSLSLTLVLALISLLSFYFIDLRVLNNGDLVLDNLIPGLSLLFAFIFLIFISIFHQSAHRYYSKIILRQMLTIIAVLLLFVTLLYVLYNPEIYSRFSINFELGTILLIFTFLLTNLVLILYLPIKKKYPKEPVSKTDIIVGSIGFLLVVIILIALEVIRGLLR
jgi:hypothetical protein